MVKTDSFTRCNELTGLTVNSVCCAVLSFLVLVTFVESWMRTDHLAASGKAHCVKSEQRWLSWLMKGLREPLTTTSLALGDMKNDRLKYHYAPKLQTKPVSIFVRNYFVWSNYSELRTLQTKPLLNVITHAQWYSILHCVPTWTSLAP